MIISHYTITKCLYVQTVGTPDIIELYLYNGVDLMLCCDVYIVKAFHTDNCVFLRRCRYKRYLHVSIVPDEA